MTEIEKVAWLALMLSSAPVVLAQEATGNARPAQWRGDIGALFGPDAYPAAAAAAGEQGRVVARLTVGDDGLVHDCKIAVSSGSAALDARTCEIALAKITLEPARDEHGRAVGTMATLPVRWVLPVPAIPAPLSVPMPDHYPDRALRRAEQGRVVARLTLAADGKVTGCSVAQSSGSASLDAEACHIALTRVHYAPAHSPAVGAMASQTLLPIQWRLPPAAVARACAAAARRHESLPACQSPAPAP